MLVLERDEQQFFISLTYLGQEQCFVLYVMLPLDVEQAGKYRVTISLEEPNSNSPTKYTYVKKVLSIDQLKDKTVAEIPSTHAVVITHTLAEQFLLIKPNQDDMYNTVHLPIYVDNILKEND